MTKDDKVLLTARYVEGDMDSLEQQLYEVRLENESDLRQYFEDYSTAHKNFRSYFPLDKTTQSFFPPQQHAEIKYAIEEPDVFPFKSIFLWCLAIASTIAVIFMVWAPWNVNLYRSYAVYQAIPYPKSFLGDSVKMQKAIFLYNDGSYLLASQLLASQHLNNPTNEALSYAYANTLIEKNQLYEARLILSDLTSKTSNYKYLAEFSTALSYVRENDVTNAKFWLKKIAKSSEIYPMAEELFSRLQK